MREWHSSVKFEDELFLYLLRFYLITRCSFFLLIFLLRLHAPLFMEAIPLYSLIIFNPSLPLVDYVGDLLDACPIRSLLEAL